MKLMLNTTTKPYGTKPCYDSFGTKHEHGQQYSPGNTAVCNQCMCENGRATQCIMVTCQIPKCKNYEQIPGRCCEYTCPRDFVLTDKSTVAVVVSLSIILVVILVAITMVWRKIQRKEKYHKRLETASTASSQQETDLESLIQKHSIPNNLRHKHGQSSEENSASPLITDHDLSSSSSTSTSSSSSSHDTLRDHNNKLLNHCVNKLNNASNLPASTRLCTTYGVTQTGNKTKTVVDLPKASNEYLTEEGKQLISKSTNREHSHIKNNNELPGAQQPHHEPCCSSSKRFEPPPPYSPPKKNGAAAFV